MIQEVAETFDVLPRIAQVEEREAAARIFPAASRAELWAIGNGHGNGNGKQPEREPAAEFIRISPAPDADILYQEHSRRNDFPTHREDLEAAYSLSGLAGGNHGQNL